MNYSNAGICRSVGPPTPVLHLLQRERVPPGKAAPTSLLQQDGWVCREWGNHGAAQPQKPCPASKTTSSLRKHVQPRARADVTAADSPGLPALCCSEARAASCHVKGPPCSHPSSPCQPTPGSGKELKQPNGPLLFNNFGTFHNLPYHAANSCALALAAAKGKAQAERCIFWM